MVYVKSLVFLLLAPGVVAVVIPYFIINSDVKIYQLNLPTLKLLSIPLTVYGAFLLLLSFWYFSYHGKGTPAPIDPPKALVIKGPYKYTRNPMYVGVVSILLGIFFYYQTMSLLIYAFFCAVAFHLRIILNEEIVMEKKFGPTYLEYKQNVRRWF